MASTAVDVEGRLSGSLKQTGGEKSLPGNSSSDNVSVRTISGDHTHRTLKSRHIQLIGEAINPRSHDSSLTVVWVGIGGTIGTALYVQIGKGLLNGGPASLFIAFSLWYASSKDDEYAHNLTAPGAPSSSP
jgi:amino acid transporter